MCRVKRAIVFHRHPNVSRDEEEKVRGIFKVNLCHVLSLGREVRVTRGTLCQHSNCLLSITSLRLCIIRRQKSQAEVNNEAMIHARIQNHLKPGQES